MDSGELPTESKFLQFLRGSGQFVLWVFSLIAYVFLFANGLIQKLLFWFQVSSFYSRIAATIGMLTTIILIILFFALQWYAWFQTDPGKETGAILLLLALAATLAKRPEWFGSILSATFVSVLMMLVFELHKTPLERGDQNHWNVFWIFIFTALPVLFSILKYASKALHGILLAIYLIVTISIAATNPNNVFTQRFNESGSLAGVMILTILGLVTLLLNKDVLSLDWVNYTKRLGMIALSCAALGYACFLAIRFFMANPTPIASLRYVFMVLILIVGCAVVISMLSSRLPHKSAVNYFSKSNLAVKYLFLLSCFTVDASKLLVGEPLQTYALLAVEIALIVWYVMAIKTYTVVRETPNGTLIQNMPVRLDAETLIPLSQHFKYNYAISCWVYLTPMAPSANPEANGFTTLLSYAGRPTVSFNASTNVMRITAKSPGTQKPKQLNDAISKVIDEVDPLHYVSAEGVTEVLIADIPNVKLQKWIHLVLNYNSSGVMDIFINGKLYRSGNVLVTAEDSGLTLGAPHGNGGRIANVMLFQGDKTVKDALFTGGDAIEPSKIQSLYKEFKHRNPPVVERVLGIKTEVSRL